ncbi:MAG: hypothetical protein GY762_23515, partial [Proteobacteria bacterium]|nr:hypothetical protein [Pseudomonadota bacterium]
MKTDTNIKKKIRAVNDQKLECSGTATFTAKYEGRTAVVSALVSSSIQDEILLSWKELVELGVIPTSFPHVETRAVNATTYNPPIVDATIIRTKTMIDSFDDVFGEVDTPRTIKKRPGINGKDVTIKPVNVCSPRKTPHAFKEREAAEKEVDNGERKGTIEKRMRPTGWRSITSFARIQNGEMRSVLDSAQLDKYVKRTTRPFPSPRNIVASISKSSKCFAVFDATREYRLVPPMEKSKDLTTFTTERGHYRRTRTPVEQIPSGGGFCHETDRALMDLEGVHKSV